MRADSQDPDSSAAPVDDTEFARAMNALGPFEAVPRLAVAVSGGADSMALALLVVEWGNAAGGRVVALTVDHHLRQGSTAEARQVGRWLRPRGIEHLVLDLDVAALPTAARRGGLQAVARAGRYGLLFEWCCAHGCLHLLLGHNLEDQAETFLLRLARGSGIAGLAAMAPLAEAGPVRILRPLLGIGRTRLIATLRARGQDWSEDPTNRDRRFARARVRAARPILEAEGLTARRLAATARGMARARAALEDAVAVLLARSVSLRDCGYARVDPVPLAGAPEEIGLRALQRILTCIGGSQHGPRLERLERLYGSIRAAASGFGAEAPPTRTLGGCHVLWRRRAEVPYLLVCRESAAACHRIAIRPGESVVWDGRFRLRMKAHRTRPPLLVAKLGRPGWAALVADVPGLRRTAVPAPVRPSLPAVWDGERPLAVPHLGYALARGGRDGGDAVSLDALDVVFAPVSALTGPCFTIAK